MNKTKDDGGFAFPFNEKYSNGEHYQTYRGITLRDYFAAAALSGLCANNLSGKQAVAICGNESLSQAAFVMADAMLQARKEGA